MKNYSDPEVWAEYLRENDLSSKIPAPSQTYINDWGELTEKALESLVADWAWRNDRPAREAEMIANAAIIDALIEATT